MTNDRMTDPEWVLSRYDDAVSCERSEFETGWNEDNCQVELAAEVEKWRKCVLSMMNGER